MDRRTATRLVPTNIIVVAAVLASLGPTAVRQPAAARAAGTYDLQTAIARVARADRLLASLTRRHQFSGSVLIAYDGRVLLKKGYGMADYAHQVRNTSATEYLIVGPTIEFSTEAVLWLMEQGKLREQDHLCAYIPHCPATWSAVTLKQLLNFTSGLHDNFIYDVNQRGLVGQPFTLDRLIALFQQWPLDFRPGTDCCAENEAFTLEEYLVERISGESFGAFLHRHFFVPLGLYHIGFYLHKPPPLPRHATGYPQWLNPYPFDMDPSFLGGMMYGTVDDLYRWHQALLAGRVLTSHWVAKLFTPSHIACPPQPQCVLENDPGQEPVLTWASGYGWFVFTTRYGRYAAMGGSLFGFSNQEMLYFPQKLTVIMLENLWNALSYFWPDLEPTLFG